MLVGGVALLAGVGLTEPPGARATARVVERHHTGYDPTTFNYGPLGSYKPSSATTGIPSGSPALTVDRSTSTLVITSGGRYDLIDFAHRTVKVSTSAPVVFTRCIFRGANSTSDTSGGLLMCFDSSVTNVKVYDSLFKMQAPNFYASGILGHHFQAWRCEVRDTNDGFGVFNNTGTKARMDVGIYGCYVHDLAYLSPDPTHPHDKPVSHTHNDCIQWQGSRGLTVQGCNLDGYCDPSIRSEDGSSLGDILRSSSNRNADGGYNAYYPYKQSNSVLQTNTATGPFGDFVWDKNWSYGGGATLNFGSGAVPLSDQKTTSRITNSRFGRDSRVGDAILGAAGTALQTHSSNNVWDDTGTPITWH